jgi:outer membrane protein TolC
MKNKVILLLSFVFLAQLPFPAAAEEPGAGQPYTLDRLLQLAGEHNLRLKISGLDKRIAVQEYRGARALPNPELEYSRGQGEIPGESPNATIWGMGLKWSMPNPIHRYFFLKSNRTYITEAEIQAEMNKREIIKGLKTHFYRLRFYQAVKTFLTEKLRILTEINTITQAKVDIGETKSIDALRSSVEIQKVKTVFFRVQKTIAYERTQLNEYLNFTLPENFTAADDFSFQSLPDIETRVSRLIETSPFIRLHANRLKREQAHLKAARLSIIDAVELFGEKEKEVEGQKWKVGIGISLPLFNQNSAHVNKAKLQRRKATIELEHARKHFFADIQRLVAEIRVLEKEIQTFQGAILKEGRENMNLSEILYKQGEVPLVVFLDSQNSFFEVRRRYYEAITEWNILAAELEALLGGVE